MTRTTQVFVGCAVGCGLLALVAVASCAGFVVWLGRPGEILEPGLLVDEATVAHAEWTLRLDDPGTERALREILDALARTRSDVTVVPNFVREWSRRRDERGMRELFPLVLTWSLRQGDAGSRDHLFGASVPSLGNRILLADWFLGFASGRNTDLSSVDHLGEQIYRIRKTGTAFFIRRSGVFVTSDVERARRTVEALDRQRTGSAAPELRRLLDEIAETATLRGAARNEAGACAAILGWLTGAPVDDVALGTVQSLALAGGFTAAGAFEATLTVRSDDPVWGAANADRIANALATRLGVDVTPVDPPADPLVLRITVDDPAGAVRRNIDSLLSVPARE